MVIHKSVDGEVLTLALEGRLDTTTSPALEEEFKTSSEGMKSVVFDFEKLEYISSAGLRVLLAAQKTMNRQGTMKVTHVNESIREILEVTGFVDILTIE